MIDITKLKAGDVITRVSHGNSEFTVGSDYFVHERPTGLYVVSDSGNDSNLGMYQSGCWEQLIIEEKLTQTFIKNIPMLLDYLKQHSITAWFSYEQHVLLCEAVYYDCVKGESFIELEEVEPNMRAVRDWLGY